MFRIRASYAPAPGERLDFAHYHAVHVPLARRQMAGRVNVLNVEVEERPRPLFDDDAGGPALTLLIDVASAADVEAFKAFVVSDAARPLHADIPNYTDCVPAWTVVDLTRIPAGQDGRGA